ncbi:hypothetical protein BGZ83_009168 [Gryganskiella cystojenkinii]|nr:hypothetical protein BGZ83_009168 [Gryganskiella cystojenkinii]
MGDSLTAKEDDTLLEFCGYFDPLDWNGGELDVASVLGLLMIGQDTAVEAETAVDILHGEGMPWFQLYCSVMVLLMLERLLRVDAGVIVKGRRGICGGWGLVVP